MNLRLINEIIRRYYDYEANNVKYSVSLWYTTPQMQEPTESYSRKHGAKLFEDTVTKLISDYGADTIIIEDYNGTNNSAKVKNRKVVIPVGASHQKAESILIPETVNKTVTTPADTSNDRNKHDFLMEQFKGFGGIQGVIQRERDIISRDTTLTLLQERYSNLDREHSQLTKDYDKLDRAYDKLRDENKELENAVRELDRHYPGNFKIAGFDGIEMLSMVASGTVEKLVKNNAPGLSKTFGMSEEALLGIFNQEQESIEAAPAPEPASNDPKMEAINNFMVWLSNLDDEKYNKVAKVIDYIWSSDEQLEQLFAVVLRGSINPDNEE